MSSADDKAPVLDALERLIQVSDWLPETLKLRMTAIRRLNQEIEKSEKSIDSRVEAFYNNASKYLTARKREKELNSIHSAILDLKSKDEERWRLASELDDYVSKVVAEVDKTLPGSVEDQVCGDSRGLELAFEMKGLIVEGIGKGSLSGIEGNNEEMSSLSSSTSSADSVCSSGQPEIVTPLDKNIDEPSAESFHRELPKTPIAEKKEDIKQSPSSVKKSKVSLARIDQGSTDDQAVLPSSKDEVVAWQRKGDWKTDPPKTPKKFTFSPSKMDLRSAASTKTKPRKRKDRSQRKEEEERFCYCDDIEHGEMIACDDPNCPFQWFHMECLEMTKAPRGKWFCSDCSERNGKKRQRTS